MKTKQKLPGQLQWCVAVMMAGMLAGCQHLVPQDKPIVQNMEESVASTRQDNGSVDAVSPVPAASAPAVAPQPPSGYAGSKIEEVRHLIQTRNARELRTTYNGNYGASLLFRPDDLTYYAVLFENRNVWRVTKTEDGSKAETAYADYVSETVRLAQADIDRIRLEAHYDNVENELLSKADELTALQRDAELERQQEMLIKSRQAQTRSDVEYLEQQEKEARKQLEELQRQIRALESRHQ